MLRDVLWKRTKDIQRCNTTQLLLFSNVQICIPFSLVHKYLNPHRKSPSHNHKYLYFASLPGTFPRLSYMQSIKTRLKIELGFCRGRTGKDHLKEERKKGQMPGGVFLNALQSFFFWARWFPRKLSHVSRISGRCRCYSVVFLGCRCMSTCAVYISGVRFPMVAPGPTVVTLLIFFCSTWQSFEEDSNFPQKCMLLVCGSRPGSRDLKITQQKRVLESRRKEQLGYGVVVSATMWKSELIPSPSINLTKVRVKSMEQLEAGETVVVALDWLNQLSLFLNTLKKMTSV